MNTLILDITDVIGTPPPGETHIGTSWQLSNFPSFDHRSFMGKSSLLDKVNLLTIEMDVDGVVDNKVYYRYNLHYTDSASGWSDVIIRAADTTKPMGTNVMIDTPTVKSKLTYTDNNNIGSVVLSTGPIKHYLGSGTHGSTTWVVENSIGAVIFEETSSEHLESISIDLSVFEDGELYTVSARHTNNHGDKSGFGTGILDTRILNGKYFNVISVSEAKEANPINVKLQPLTTQFKSADLKLTSSTGILIAEVTSQSTIFPSVKVPEKTANTPYHLYARLTLNDGVTTDYILIATGVISELNLYGIDPSISYLSAWDYNQELPLRGITSHSSFQLPDGSVVLTKVSSTKLYRYYLVDGVLLEQGVLYDLGSDANIVLPYLTVSPMYNGNILITYAGNTLSLTDQYTVLMEMSYNSASKTLELVSSVRQDTMWQGFSVSASIVPSYNNDVYYIPSILVDDNEQSVKLKLFKTNMTSKVTESYDLPFDAFRHISMVPLSGTKFLIIGGTTDYEIVNGYFVWTRTNETIYMFDAVTETFSAVGSLPAELVPSIYNLQGYLRKDGKVVLFNATRTGTSQGNQNTYLYDPTANTMVVEYLNLPIDVLPYRSSIVLNNGCIMRISARTKDPQYVYTYISNTKTQSELNTNPTVLGPITELVVNNEPVDIEDLNIYDKVTIIGTGVLRWQNGDVVDEFTSTDLIITRDTTMTSAEITAGNYGRIVKLFNAALIIEV